MAVVARRMRAMLDVGTASVAVLRARRVVSKSPLGTLVGMHQAVSEPGEGSVLEPGIARITDRWGRALDRALRILPGDSACLVRAAALRDILVARGVPGAEVRIGVRRGADGFEAHAWVELDGTPLAEPVALRGAFASLDGVTLRQ